MTLAKHIWANAPGIAVVAGVTAAVGFATSFLQATALLLTGAALFAVFVGLMKFSDWHYARVMGVTQ